MNYIDMHCDTLGAGIIHKKDTITHLLGTMVDIERLRKADVKAQFFAMFLPQRNNPEWFGYEKMPSGEELMEEMYGIFQNTLKENADVMALAQSYEDLQKNMRDGKMSAFLTIENAYLVDGKMENIKKFHEMGVGLMTLTWNDPNCFGHHHSEKPDEMAIGLTDFGKEAISYMNDLGVIIDVSHLSDGGFYDVAKFSKKPFVASHSNCRALCLASRNLTDDMIRLLADCGGVAGINLEPSFLNADMTDSYSRVSVICDHIEHFIKIGGTDCVGIGSDFDGIGGKFEIADCTAMDLMFHELKKRKISDSVIDKIAYQNVERVIRDSMKSAF